MSTADPTDDEGSTTMSGSGFSPREETYSITEVEQISGLAAHTLRWYEQLGLIDNVSRGPGGKRVYSALHLRWLEFLSGVRDTGMSVADMTRYVALAREGDRTIPLRRQMVEEHRALVQRRSEELATTLRYLDWKIDAYRQFEESTGIGPRGEGAEAAESTAEAGLRLVVKAPTASVPPARRTRSSRFAEVACRPPRVVASAAGG